MTPYSGNVIKMQRPYGKVAMKKSALLIILLPLCACAERFVIDGHAKTTVDVSLQGEMLIVVCRFPARSRFDDAINVRLNDQKGRRLFLEGLIRYFRAGSDGIMEVSGQRILETRKDGDRMSYKFAVPKDGCRARTPQTDMARLPIVMHRDVSKGR